MELPERMTNEQLLQHLEGLGQWTETRARELKDFTDHLAARVAEAGGDPQRLASLRYALQTYVDGVQDLLTRFGEAQVELQQRLG